MKNYEKFKNITIDNKQSMNKLKKILLFRTHSKKVKRRGRKKKYNLLEEKTTSTIKNYPTNKLSSDNNDINSLICLLLIFNFINEACNDRKMVIDEISRKKFKKNITNISGDVFQFITFLINKLNNIQEDKILKKFITDQILETLINYISIELDESVLIKFNNDYLPIINFIFQINEDNLEKHSECICYLLQLPLHKDNMR
jgi:hypothetical protein